jgi:probable phosphoglycerate mutase
VVAVSRVWLLRHCSTVSGEEGRLLGWRDEPLSPTGRRHALSLRKEVEAIAPDHVWSSDLRRAVETARLASREPRVDGRLREIDFGRLEGLTWERCSVGHREALARFEGFAAPDGETLDQLRVRVHAFVEELGPGRHLVVTHGGVVRLLLREAGDLRPVEPGKLLELV